MINDNRRFISKPWGWEEHICGLGKKLFIKKGFGTSWHRNEKKNKVILVDKGELIVYHGASQLCYDASNHVLKDGDSISILCREYNRLTSLSDCYITEFFDYYDIDGLDVTRYDPVTGLEIK